MTSATTKTTLVAELARLLPPDVAWLLRETDDADAVRLLIGDRVGMIRGTLDGQGFEVRESDVPVNDGWETLLEIRQ